jgi:PAS domain S-box-containing protein
MPVERGTTRVLSDAAVATLGDLVALTVVDADGTLVYVSDRWCELSGHSREEVLGTNWKWLVPIDDSHAVVARSHAAVRTGETQRFRTRILRTDGAPVWIEAHVAPLTDDQGAWTHWMMVALDVTARQAAAEALERSERRLQVIVENSTDIITILEPDGTWRSTSTSGRRLLGYGEGPFPDGGPLALIEDEDLPVVQAALAELRERTDGGFGRLFECRARARDGRIVWLETMGVNLLADPMVRGIVLHSRDVTDRHAAVEALHSMDQRIRALVEHLFVGVLMADQDGQIIYANQAAADLFRLGPDPWAMIGRGREELQNDLRHLYTDYDAALARIVEIMQANEPVLEELVTFSDGRNLARSFVPITSGGESLGHVWLFRDLGEEIAIAAEREYLLEIEKKQNLRLTELDSLRSDLVASVSHELRTPLTSIVSFTHLLRDGLATDTLRDQAEFLDIIDRNTDRLLRLVDDLLLLDRLEAHSLQLSIEPVDVPALVEMAVSSIRPVAEARGVAVINETPGSTEDQESIGGALLHGDVNRLGQLVDNLLTNAVKFTRSGGHVEVAATATEEGWRVTVQDDGIGIPADEVGRLFRRFYRASNARGEAMSGTGLGLVIALRISELHGGSIEIDSTEDVGTTITVALSDAVDPSLPTSPLGGAAP